MYICVIVSTIDVNDCIFCLNEQQKVYDGALAHNNPAISGPNSELKKLPPYSLFLNVVDQVP